MAPLKQQFEKATVEVRGLTKRPTSDSFEQSNGLFKQATASDAAGKRPGLADLLGRGRYDGWAAYKSLSADDAVKQNITGRVAAGQVQVDRLLGGRRRSTR